MSSESFNSSSNANSDFWDKVAQIIEKDDKNSLLDKKEVLFGKIRKDPQWRKASVTVSIEFKGQLDTSYFKQHKLNQLHNIFLPEKIENEILSKRSPEQKIKDEQRGVSVFTAQETIEYENILKQKLAQTEDPVDNRIKIVDEQTKEKINSVIDNVQSSDSLIDFTLDQTTAHEFVISGADFHFAIQPKWKKSLLKLGWGLGIIKPPVTKSVKGPVICSCVHIQIDGLGEQVNELAENVKEQLENFGDSVRIDIDYMNPNQKTVTELVFEKEEQKTLNDPLPMVGTEFVNKTKELCTLLKNKNAVPAFEKANEIVQMFKQHKDLAQIFMYDKKYKHCRVELFRFDSNGRSTEIGDRNPREIARTLQNKLKTLQNERNLDGLCDLFFEYSPKGIWNSLEDQTQSLSHNTNPSKIYKDSFERIFGSANHFYLTIEDIRKSEMIPTVKRIELIYAERVKEHNGWIEARKEASNIDQQNLKQSEITTNKL